MIGRLIAGLAATTFLLASPLMAQRGFGGRSAPRGGVRYGFSRSGARRGERPGLRGLRRGGFPYPYDPYLFWDDFPDDNEPPEPSGFGAYVPLEGARPSSPAPPPSPSVLLQLQGDHWVRITSFGQTPVGTQTQENLQSPGASGTAVRTSPQRNVAVQPVHEVPSTVLAFRDGREEEIKGYTIVGATLSTGADYWRSGSWRRRIPLADLDLDRTVRRNQEHGMRFVLPSGPNEVIVGP